MAAVTEPPVRTGAVDRRTGSRPDGWPRMCLVVAAAIAGFAVVLGSGVGAPTFGQSFSNLGLFGVSALAACACLGHARRLRARLRAGWTLIGAGTLSWSLGQVCWFWLESVGGEQQVPFPSVADIGYLGMVALVGAGLLALPAGQRSLASRARSVLDGLMVAVSILLVAWMFVVGPLLTRGADSTLALVISLAYPVGDVVMITLVAYQLAMQRRHGRHLMQLVAVGGGIVAFAAADIGYAYLDLIGVYASGSVTDIGWFAGFALILLAARTPPDGTAAQTPAGGQDGRAFGVMLPYVAVLSSLITSIAWNARTGQSDPVVSFTRTALILLITSRQLLTMLENRDLTRDLESRVRERTAELYAREQRFQALVQHSNDVVTVVDPDSRVLYQSRSLQRVFGHRADLLTGRRLIELLDGESATLLITALTEVLRAPSATTVVEFELRHRDGGRRLAETTITNLLGDPNVAGVVLNTRDITQRRKLQDQLVHEAYHDALTQLANRALFKERTRQALQARQPSDDVTVLYLDLDGFKEVNDSLGHLAGDDLLVQVAGRLQAGVHGDEMVARFGGDEFAVLVTSPDVAAVTRRILDGLDEPFRIGARETHVRASIGVASASTAGPTGTGPAGDDDAEQLIRNADLAMYRAKAAGGGVVEFDPQMLAGLIERLELEADLRGAIDRDELELHYQPTVRLADNQVVGFEALLRWRHPTRGLVAPLDFIPLAEAAGLIAGIGQWVLREACRQAVAWAALPGRRPVTMAVNLSVRQFDHGDLPTVLADVLAETRMPADRLCLEMTESVLMDDTEENLGQLVRLKALGVMLAIDDFGTGYSSLAYLRRFPVDTLKIDRSFVRRLGEQTDDAALADTIVQLGRSLGMSTVAEGIEEFGQLAALREMGCEFAQGFYFSRPLPAAEAGHLLPGPPVAAAAG